MEAKGLKGMVGLDVDVWFLPAPSASVPTVAHGKLTHVDPKGITLEGKRGPEFIAQNRIVRILAKR